MGAVQAAAEDASPDQVQAGQVDFADLYRDRAIAGPCAVGTGDMAKPRDSKPYIWATWLSKLLSGDNACEWRAWFQAHHLNGSWTRAETTFDNVRWTMDHTKLLRDTRGRLEDDGYSECTDGEAEQVLA